MLAAGRDTWDRRHARAGATLSSAAPARHTRIVVADPGLSTAIQEDAYAVVTVPSAAGSSAMLARSASNAGGSASAIR